MTRQPEFNSCHGQLFFIKLPSFFITLIFVFVLQRATNPFFHDFLFDTNRQFSRPFLHHQTSKFFQSNFFCACLFDTNKIILSRNLESTTNCAFNSNNLNRTRTICTTRQPCVRLHVTLIVVFFERKTVAFFG